MKGSYFGNFINGKWVQHPGRDVFEVRNPATNQIIATIEQGTKEDIELAVNVAESKFESWRKIPAPKRGEIILEAARILRDEKEELARRIVIQNGKIISEARGEVQEAIDFFEYIAGEGRRLWGETIPSELPNKICLTFRKPIGVVALITPFNYPLAIPAWKIGAALICGNTIVMKPPSLTPLGAIDLANIFQRAGLPDGVFNLVFGRGEEVGMALVEHPKIRVVSFTGGEEVGRRIYQQAASDLKRVHLELGGHAPEIILEDANIDLAIEAVLFGAFGTSGQRCTTTRRLLVSSVIYDKVKTKLIQKIRSLKVGDPLDE
ncbi:MAG TPA: aldehyde dehydrogenase, partial [Archaeoglobaceae archaeon]|nr:aldehyde dehydrogenase [Archaeoglobaceae archaeon]